MAWKWQAKDKNDKVVESSPGRVWFFCRGHDTKESMIRGANLLLNQKRLDAVRFGFPDPGYRLDVESVTFVDETPADLGAGPLPDLTASGTVTRPADVVPLDLPLDKAVNAKHEELIAKKGG